VSDQPIVLRAPVQRSARTVQLESIFDLGSSSESVVTLPAFPMDKLSERTWSIGLIVGPSGSGKTQTARHAFAEHWPEPFEWDNTKAVVDNLSAERGVKEIVNVLSSVGFSSPPAWLRPYNILSNGEKFRVEIARALLEDKPLTIIDEFTSVVDRQVAKIASSSVAKAVRSRKQQLIAVSCHYDIEDWLQPDWVYQPGTGEFTWRSVQPRPQVEVEIVKGSTADWPLFARHHYLSHTIPNNARVMLGKIDGQPVGLIAAATLVTGSVNNAWRLSRVVILPDYQGLGLGTVLSDLMAAALTACGKKVYITTSHPGFVRSLNKSKVWALARATGLNPIATKIGKRTNAWDRLTAGFRYVGPGNVEAGKVIAGGALQVKS
jgi:hypothetical protein